MCRSGFTLFEMLIALTLTSVVLVIAYAGMHRGALLRNAGQVDAEQDRYARAILRGFETMVTQASMPRERSTGNAWEIESPAALANVPSVPLATKSRSDELPVDCGLWGNEQFLAVCLDPAMTRTEQASGLNHGTLSVLAYLPLGKCVIPRRSSHANIDTSAVEPELAETANWLWFDAATHLTEKADVLTILAPRYRQVGELRCTMSFRYFDGQTWHDAWDTLERGDNPRAIELTLRSIANASERVYRTIAIPPRSSGGAK
ncbi:MAG: prepilin-type N-terminal cleavage/methylation domain-containing protein [Planctomycetaceae bacterium]|nr:prepilin-type N-terminal cleavage/methylation domain-containing protein [Planctomycetaceae bacterium]